MQKGNNSENTSDRWRNDESMDYCLANLVCAAIFETLRQSRHYLVSIKLDSAAWKRNTNCAFLRAMLGFFSNPLASQEKLQRALGWVTKSTSASPDFIFQVCTSK